MPSAKNSNTDDAVVDRVARLYGLDVRRQLLAVRGYRNESRPLELADGSCVNLIIYKREPDIVGTIRNANRVAGFLAEHNFPVRRTLDGRIVRLQSGQINRYAALYNYLPGNTIAWEAYSQNHLKLLGKTMSDMHAALQDFDATDLPDAAEVYLQIFARMRGYFAEPGVRSALKMKLRLAPPDLVSAFQTLELCTRLPDKQALHLDFVRGNVLFGSSAGGPEISGILDFEKTARGHCLFDVARTLAFLLVDCKYKPPAKVRKYFLRSGYQKRGAAELKNLKLNSKSAESNLLEYLIHVFLLHDFYKFLRHNPYESLLANEHFIRTCGVLIGFGSLAVSGQS
jgi:Ser/Thr protein kinase RdoA (MazF antagonist)